MKVKSESEVAQSCPTLRDPMNCSLPGSSVHGIFQARVLEWGAIAFSDITVYIHVNVFSRVAAAFSSYDGDLSLPLGLALGSPIFPSQKPLDESERGE